MAAGRYSFVIEQGATTDFEVIYNDSDCNPIDLAGYEARMSIRQSQNRDSQLYITSKSTVAPCSIVKEYLPAAIIFVINIIRGN